MRSINHSLVHRLAHGNKYSPWPPERHSSVSDEVVVEDQHVPFLPCVPDGIVPECFADSAYFASRNFRAVAERCVMSPPSLKENIVDYSIVNAVCPPNVFRH